MTIRKIEFLGVPATVGTPAELRALAEAEGFNKPGQNLHVIARVADFVDVEAPEWLRKRRYRMPCERCGEICYYLPESIVDEQAMFVCRQCALLELRERAERDDD